MTGDDTMDRRHPVVRFHRIGTATVGIILAAFGVLGFTGGAGFLATHGGRALGLTSEHLLATIWLVLALVLVVSALSARAAAQTAVVIGALLLVVGLLSMALLHTPVNGLGLTIWDLIFALVVGLVLLSVGLFGRASGQLPADNPYRRARGGRNPMSRLWHDEDLAQDPPSDPEAEQRHLAEVEDMAHAEQAFAEGEATPEQEQRVLSDASRRAGQRRRAAWRHAEREP
jgi:hypothetical protein